MNKERIRVLCIDDEPHNLQPLTDHLVNILGVEVAYASTFTGAKKKIQNGNVDLISLDLMIPYDEAGHFVSYAYGGIVLLKNLRNGRYGEIVANIPVVIVSACHPSEIESMIKNLPSCDRTWLCDKCMNVSEAIKTFEAVLNELEVLKAALQKTSPCPNT